MALLIGRSLRISTSYCDKIRQNVLKQVRFYRTIKQSTSHRYMKYGYWPNFKSVSAVVGLQYLKNPYCAKTRFLSSATKEKPLNLESLVHYENVTEETLESIFDRFEELLQSSKFKDWDVNYSNGVLTITLEENCVYVINKQTPNRQIWLSSPISGPKRYDYINGIWTYKHDGVSLHQLLSTELTELLQTHADFMTCPYSN